MPPPSRCSRSRRENWSTGVRRRNGNRWTSAPPSGSRCSVRIGTPRPASVDEQELVAAEQHVGVPTPGVRVRLLADERQGEFDLLLRGRAVEQQTRKPGGRGPRRPRARPLRGASRGPPPPDGASGPLSANSCCSGVVVGIRVGLCASGSGTSCRRSRSVRSRRRIEAVQRAAVVVRVRQFQGGPPSSPDEGAVHGEHRVAPGLDFEPSAVHPPEPAVVRVDRLLRGVGRAALPVRGREHDLAVQPLQRPALPRRTGRRGRRATPGATAVRPAGRSRSGYRPAPGRSGASRRGSRSRGRRAGRRRSRSPGRVRAGRSPA
jgi:hypothetical protein